MQYITRYSRVINTVNKRLESEVGGYDNVHYLDCTDLFLEVCRPGCVSERVLGQRAERETCVHVSRAQGKDRSAQTI